MPVKRSDEVKRFADIVRQLPNEPDPESHLKALLEDAGVSPEEFYLFAHYVRRVAWTQAVQILNDDEEQLRCSFCLRTREEAGAMVQGTNAAICDRCTKGAVHTLKETGRI